MANKLLTGFFFVASLFLFALQVDASTDSSNAVHMSQMVIDNLDIAKR